MALRSILVSTVCALALFLCNSCEENAPRSIQRMWNCHHQQNWEAEWIFYRLIGNWEWEFIDCFDLPEGANGSEFTGLTVAFNSDSTLLASYPGKATIFSKWEVVPEDGTEWGLITDPPINELAGRLLFCDKRLLCNNSYIDGCDNYFREDN